MAYALVVSEPPPSPSLLAQMAHAPSSYGNRSRGNIQAQKHGRLVTVFDLVTAVSAQLSKTEANTEPLCSSVSWGHQPSRLIILDHLLWEGQ